MDDDEGDEGKEAEADRVNSATDSESVEEMILRKYEFCQKLGKGAFGVVWKVIYKMSRKPAALKKVFHAWRTRRDAQRMYREITYLQALRGHDNIVDMRRMYPSKDDRDLYLEFEYCEADLHGVIRADILSESHIRYLSYQLLRGLKYIHSAGLVHRDIRPANILVRPDCSLKIADFGNARLIDPARLMASTAFGNGGTGAGGGGMGGGLVGGGERERPPITVRGQVEGPADDTIMTEYVSARWYRAPEILLGSHDYGQAPDVWGFGCVLAEMIRGKPIFPGTSTLNQIKQILALTGRPSEEEIEQLRSPFALSILEDVRGYVPQAMSEIFPEANGEALDLLRLTLQFSCDRRPDVDAALRHPWVMDYHNPEDEPCYEGPLEVPVSDNIMLENPAAYRDVVYEMIERQNLLIQKAEAEMSNGFMLA